MPDLRVMLLGAPQASVGRTAVETDTRKATALARDASCLNFTCQLRAIGSTVGTRTD